MAKCHKIPFLVHNRPKCEAILSEQTQAYKNSEKWPESHNGLRADECGNHATILIEGQKLCRKHASMVAIDILLNEGDE